MRAVLVFLGYLAIAPVLAAPAGPSEDARFQQLIDRIWAWDMDQFPEWATYLGKRTGLDRWTDHSPKVIEERKTQTRTFLADLEKIDAAQLTKQRRLDYNLLLHDFRNDVAGQRFPDELLALNQLGGVHQDLAELMDIAPAEKPADLEAALTRLRTFPAVVDQNIALLERGLAAGVTAPRVTLAAVPSQIAAILARDSIDNPILAPFRRDSAQISPIQRAEYQKQALEALHASVFPALRKFQQFIDKTYLPGARETIGISALPDGEAWYAFDARVSTTTELTPEQIHAIGKQEVARIEDETTALRKKLKFKGDSKAFGDFLRSDSRFYYLTTEDLLAAYRDLCKRIDPELPRFFGKLPRLTYGVRPVPDYAADSKPTAYYQGGSPESGRPGYFYVNTVHLDQRPKWQMEVLALHEAVPGHHLQIALAQEMDEKPELLRERSYTAFIEGWGLYAESLGKEMGFYTDPYADYGRLTFEMWRAVRLVVDTGIHALGWTREEAIAYFREHTAMSDYNIKVEVDRYISWPGQALAYKIGQMKILELRQRAEIELGDKFDIRAFHDAVLGEGAVPLDTLAGRVDEWIAARKAGK